MPLSEHTLNDFDPKLQHLLAEITRCDELRRSKKEVIAGYESDRYSGDKEKFYIDKKARTALDDVLKYITYMVGDLPQFGIEKKYRHHLSPLDLTLDEIIQVLNTKLPPRYAELGAQIMMRIYRREILHTLSGGVTDPYPTYGTTEHGLYEYVTTGYRLVVNGAYNPNFNVTPAKKTRVYPGHNGFTLNGEMDDYGKIKESQRFGHRIIYLEGSEISTTNEEIEKDRDGVMVDGRNYRKRETNFSRNIAYKAIVNTSGIQFEDVRFIAITGKIESAGFKNCTVVAGKGLTMVGGEWISGRLEIEDVCNIRAQFFLNTEISLKELPETGDVIFYGCDFSHAIVSDDDLIKIAKRCDAKCTFSDEQIAKLQKVGVENAGGKPLCSSLKAQEKIRRIKAVGGKRSKNGNPNCDKRLGIASEPEATMITDYLDPERKDIPNTPVLKNGNKVREVYDRETYKTNKVDERLFAPLTSADPEMLSARITFFKKLADFVGKKEKISNAEMLQFIIDNGESACTAMGLSPEFLDLPEVCSLPPRRVLNNWRPPTNRYDVEANNFVEIQLPDGKKMIVTLDQFIDNYDNEGLLTFKPLDTEYMQIPGLRDKNVIQGKNMKNTYYGVLQDIKTDIDTLCENLVHYGRYLHALTSEYKYEWPELQSDEGKNHQFRGLFDPNLPGQLSADKSVVTNDVELPANESAIIALTGPNRDAGKTTLMRAISHAISQAQAGAPSAGKTTISAKGQYDHILVLPNARVQKGGSDREAGRESGMENRGRVLKEFLTRVSTLAKSGTTKKPVKMVICLDEIMMGVTDPRAGRAIELNMVDHLMNEIPGLQVTILLISPDPAVIEKLKERFGDKMQFLAPPPDGTPHKLVVSEKPGRSLPDNVLKDADLANLGKVHDWMKI